MKGLERYELLEEVGQGGMSTVWRGLDRSLGREVAVKVLHPHLAGEQESRKRLQREAQAVAKLHHPNILQIYDYSGVESPSSFIVTEFIHGRTLKDFLAATSITVPEIAAAIVLEVCQALEHAHAEGVIHRDLKPENIMIRNDGALKLTDFGIAQIVDVTRLTVTGEIVGSPAYMAPEQIDGRPQDFRTDVFSIGTLLFQLSTGELPFRGKNPHEVLKRIAEGRYTNPTQVSSRVDDSLGRIIRKALEHRPADRYPTVKELNKDLERYLADADQAELRQNLAGFFKKPAAWVAESTPPIVEALTRLGKSALERGKTASALALFNRALCRDPKNADVLALLDRLSRHRRLNRQLAAVGLLLLLIGMGVAAVRFWPAPSAAAIPKEGQRLPVREPAPRVVSESDVAGAGLGPAASADVSKALPDGAEPRDGGEEREPTAMTPAPPTTKPSTGPTLKPMFAGKRTIEIVPFPKVARMKLDGKKLGWYGAPHKSIRVGPGAHTLLLENDQCEPKTIRISANDRRKRITARLRWKDALVTVETNVAEAEILIAGRVGKPGQTIRVPLPERGGPAARVPLAVRAAGYELYTSRVSVRAGEASPKLRVDLRKSP